jgi:two-component system LytT family response regulator
MARTDTGKFAVLIADDEPAARRGVRQLLASFPAFAVARECRNGAEVLAALDVVSPDVVFLDIQMPEVGGFEVIRRRTPERMPPVVFLTAYDQYAIRAFEAQALDYLVKPVTEARFAATMKRLARQLGAGADTSSRTESIAVTTSRGVVMVALRDIDWIEAADNYARIWTKGRGLLIREPMRLLEQRVRPAGFVRAHRRALVRLAGVRALTRTRTGVAAAVLASGERIPVSRRRRAGFAAALRERRA